MQSINIDTQIIEQGQSLLSDRDNIPDPLGQESTKESIRKRNQQNYYNKKRAQILEQKKSYYERNRDKILQKNQARRDQEKIERKELYRLKSIFVLLKNNTDVSLT
jgi:hypothetical protein